MCSAILLQHPDVGIVNRGAASKAIGAYLLENPSERARIEWLASTIPSVGLVRPGLVSSNNGGSASSNIGGNKGGSSSVMGVKPPKVHKIKSLCKWSGRVDELESHRSTCDHAYGQCPHRGCKNKTVAVKNMAAHDIECRKRQVMCNNCFNEIPLFGIDFHEKYTCPKTVLSCTNHDCNIKYERGAMNLHLNVCATQEVIPCPEFPSIYT
jgi:hypothetical protein